MDEENNWLTRIAIFLLWAVSSVLNLWTMVVARQGLLVSMARFYVGDDIVRGWQARFFDKVFFVLAGLVWLIVVFLTEAYFRVGIRKHVVRQRAARIFGVELLVLFVLSLVPALVGAGLGGTLSTLMLVGELVVGGGLYAYSVMSKPDGDTGQE